MKKATLSILFLVIISFSQAQTPEDNLIKAGIILPKVSSPIANYINVVRVGNLLFLSGKGPLKSDGSYIVGKLGQDITIENGYEAARLVAINQLAVLKNELGELSKIKQVVKVLGLVNSAATFYDQPKVMNGFSDLMVLILGDKGKHARSAIGTNTLPNNMAVEVEIIVEVY